MVGNPDTWWGTHTWWAAHIHGGQLWGRGAPQRPPGFPEAGRLAGQATMYVGSPPCMWVPNHAFGFPAMYFAQRYQLSGITYQLSNGTRMEYKSKNGTRMEPRFEKWNADGT